MKKNEVTSKFEREVLKLKKKKSLSIFISLWIVLGLVVGINLLVINKGLQGQSDLPEEIEEMLSQSGINVNEVPITTVSNERSMSFGDLLTSHKKDKDLLAQAQEDMKENPEAYSQNCYCYNNLTENEKTVYNTILCSLLYRVESVEINASEAYDLSVVYQCVLADHPEIFYTEGFEYQEVEVKKGKYQNIFYPLYNMDESTMKACQDKLDIFTKTFLEKAPLNGSEYDKAKFAYEYVIDKAEYEKNVNYNQEIVSIVIYGKSVCNGYAKLFQYLTNKLGLKSVLISGYAGNEAHAWDAVKIDDKWYFVDPTWGDTSYTNSKDSVSNYDCFCITTKELERTHKIKNIIDPPECISNDANYYVHEGLFFEDVDLNKVENIFKAAYEKNKELIVIKCANDIIYSEMKKQLIEEQKVLEYYQTTNKEIEYIANDKTLTFKFYL